MICGHYTSQEGLIGIIKTQSIWVTNIKFLNDEHEFEDALELIKELVQHSKITRGNRDYDANVAYREAVEKQLQTRMKWGSDRIYTFSLSKERDLLSQWRGYCPLNNGFCVDFNVTLLLEQAVKATIDSHLVACIYEQKEKEKKLKSLLNTSWRLYLAAKSDHGKAKIMDGFGLARTPRL